MKAATTADGSTDAFVITTALESEAGLRVCRGGELWGVFGATRSTSSASDPGGTRIVTELHAAQRIPADHGRDQASGPRLVDHPE